jgi:hypothetical protein
MKANGTIIKGRYFVSDIEHNGDLNRAKSYVSSLGCVVTNTYWDGVENGIAYVDFTFTDHQFARIYKELIGSEVRFSKDINDYLDFGDETLVSSKELSRLVSSLENDFHEGFEKKIPLELFFETRGIDKDKFLHDVMLTLGDTASIVAKSVQVVDGHQSMDVLITMDYKEITYQKLEEIGQYCLGNHDGSLIKEYDTYGEIRVKSVLGRRVSFNSQEEVEQFKWRVYSVMNKLNLTYKTTNLYLRDNSDKYKEYTYEQYMDNFKLRDWIEDDKFCLER